MVFPSTEGEERNGMPRIPGVKTGDERQRGENLDRKGEPFMEDIQIANKHMKPNLTLLHLRKVYMCNVFFLLF